MKLLSAETEMAALKTICSRTRTTASSWLFSGLDSSYFYYGPCVEAYDRISSLVKSRGTIPNYLEICSDPSITESNRQLLLGNKYKAVTTKASATSILGTLSKYRKVRLLYFNAEETLKNLHSDKIAVEDVLEKNTNALANVRASNTLTRELLHFGRGNNSTSLVKKLLSNEKAPVIPTGFTAFDKKNGGFFPGSLVVIGATTGGGKCIVGDSLILCQVNGVAVPIEIETLWETQPGVDEEYKGGIRRTLKDFFLIYRHDNQTAAVSHMYKTTGSTIKVTLQNGKSLEGRPEHKIKCCTPEGSLEFKTLDCICIRDLVVVKSPPIHSDVAIYSQVVSIERKTDLKILYDLMVPHGNEYVANGIASHNSAMANQLLINMASSGYDTVMVPLEMTDEECSSRLLANLSGVNVSKFLLRKVTVRERNIVKTAYREWILKLKELDSRYTIYDPEEDVSIEDVLFLLKPYGYKVILIDYISLLKGVDGDDQWRQLSAVARFGKIFAKTHKILVVLLVQVSAEGAIRYSKAVGEHGNNCWLWTYSDENKESGIIEVRQFKARNQEAFPFQLAVDFASMRFRDVSVGESGVMKSSSGDKVRKNLEDMEDYLADIGEDDDD